ncbi:glycosyltransferase [Limimaricola pyoseonensis]|uniref:Glycosyltransferase involved in cell wall bisynthesis n=1 Tax=Limimaricola pyoseonensis TaxID=521013 RepID=A0A1G7KJW3_9RHOB|nr:glycosyltransferase [Limimaricola pyoseonensis]SDF37435.1 Glycosyltransferase involved in cell wall bisynthesis [Limimaricola pyoseonensis]
MTPQPPFDRPVRLLTHGAEDTTQGGPSVRVPRTAQALRDAGVAATAAHLTPDQPIARIPEDVVHLFNVWPPENALRMLRRLRRAGKRIVFSPIYLDFSEMPLWADAPDPAARGAMRRYLQGRGRLHEITPGYHAMLREMIALADHVVFLSARERAGLEEIGARVPDARASLLRNPVDAALWQGGEPELFRATWLQDRPGPRDYVLCIARIEERKNQLRLARAMRDLPARLVLMGHAGSSAYAAQLRAEGGPDLVMTGRVPHGGEMMRSALAGARAFALPSWAEGASLAALEAAAAGTDLVLSDRSSEREYFGDLARYCDPGDEGSIRAALAETLAADASRGPELARMVAREHGWAAHAEATARAYATAAAADPLPAPCQPTPRAAPKLVLDVTGLDRAGPESPQPALVAAFLRSPEPPRLVAWHPAHRRFAEMPAAFASPAQAARHLAQAGRDGAPEPARLDPDETLLVTGEAWQESDAYLRDLEDLKTRSGAGLAAVVPDLAAHARPALFPAEHAAALRPRAHRLFACLDHLAVLSPHCARDAALVEADRAGAPLDVTVLSGMAERETEPAPPRPAAPASAIAERLAKRRFVLVDGPVAARRNLHLLQRVWSRFANEDRHPDLHLVLPGRLSDPDLARQIAGDPRLAGRVHLLDGTTPADRDWLYENCLFSLCPALDEGWDWPVTESLRRGTPHLASDIPAFRDGAAAAEERLDPDDIPGWAERISQLAERAARPGDLREGLRPGQRRDWDGHARTLCDVLAAPRPIATHRPLAPGLTAAAGPAAPPLRLGFKSGWHPASGEMRWMAAPQAGLRIGTAPAEGAARLLLLKLAPPPWLDRRQRLRLRLGDTVLHDAPAGPEDFPRELLLGVPEAGPDGALDLALDFPVAPAPASGTPEAATPPGVLGLALVSATLLDPDISNPLSHLDQPGLWSEGAQGLEIDFAIESHRAAIAAGLAHAAPWGVGTTRDRVALRLPLLPGCPAGRLEIGLRPVATAERPSGAVIRWNGRHLAEQAWSDDQPRRLVLPLGEADLAGLAPAVLEIALTSLMTPADLGLGACDTLAGLALTDIAFIPGDADGKQEPAA